MAQARAARERLAGPVLAAARLAVAWALAVPEPRGGRVGQREPGIQEAPSTGPRAEEAARPSSPESGGLPRPEVPAFSAPKAGGSPGRTVLHWSLKSDLPSMRLQPYLELLVRPQG